MKDCLSPLAMPDSASSHHYGESITEASTQFVRLVYMLMRCVNETVPLSDDWGFDTWYARNGGEAYAYAKNLAHLEF